MLIFAPTAELPSYHLSTRSYRSPIAFQILHLLRFIILRMIFLSLQRLISLGPSRLPRTTATTSRLRSSASVDMPDFLCSKLAVPRLFNRPSLLITLRTVLPPSPLLASLGYTQRKDI